MRNVLRQVIPSMFHRRLLLVGLVTFGLMVLLAAQTARLTTGEQHADRQKILRKSLERPDLTPTARGRIYDRKNRLLATDRPGWDVAVSFDLLSGNWAYIKARKAARDSIGWRAWREQSPQQQDELASQYVGPYLHKIESLKIALADFGQVSLEDVEDRQREIVSWVQRMVGAATARKRRSDQVKVLKQKRGKDLSWAEVYVEVAEEYQSHAVLIDVGDQTVSWVDQYRARAIQEEERYDHAVKLAQENNQPRPPDDREYDAWLEVAPQRVRKRSYPWESRTFVFDRSTLPGPLRSDRPIEVTIEGIGRHILGTLRPIHNGDALWSKRPYSKRETQDGPLVVDLAGYRPGDPIGRFGIERSMESVLRGQRGQRVTHLDTGETHIEPPLPGGDIRLTIDIQLQMRLQAIMSHNPAIGLMHSQPWHHAGDKPLAPKLGDTLNGAAIVIDIDNSEVLAAVSVPGVTFDQYQNHSVELLRDHVNQPYIFRPVGYAYDPGSTNKPLVLAAAITDGILGPDDTLDCSLGHLWEDRPDTFRDWINKTNKTLNFGALNGVEAITVSSNVFFGRIAQMFGEQMDYKRLAWWFYQYGFGRRADVGLYEERRGSMPSIDADEDLDEWTAVYMAIGEGGMSATPLQIVNAHATLARGGLFIPPTFIQQIDSREPQRQVSQLHLSPAARDRALRGMYAAANVQTRDWREHGTTSDIRFDDGHTEANFTVPGVKVYAKSGTAEASPLRQLTPDGRPVRGVNPDGTRKRGEVVREGNHAWVVALVQPEGELRPTHAIAVVVEYAGSGGRTAGPIVNQIIRALAIEGYLGDAAVQAVRHSETGDAR